MKYRDTTFELHPNMILLVGGNNSGKTTLLHALATWEFCKTVLTYEKSPKALLNDFSGDGYGITIDDFTPINLPSFKSLWTNLTATSGYTLSIKCYWDDNTGNEKFLEISLALAQERLYIKPTASNLVEGDVLPKIAYLPTFAGIGSKEQWFSKAYRNKLIGQGLAGAILRNQIMELWLQNIKLRNERKNGRMRLSDADLKYIRENDPYDILNQYVFKVFQGVLYPKRFDPEFHTHVQINFRKGEIKGKRFAPFTKYNERDIMMEGRGFLQWLSVLTFVLTPDINVLLLDEPDSHLHCVLKSELFDDLKQIAAKQLKQVIVATHSSEVIKAFDYAEILSIIKGKPKYLTEEEGKCLVLSSLGTEFFPSLESLQRNKKAFLVENNSDAKFLEIFCNKFDTWPDNITIWATATKHKERKAFYNFLRNSITDLKVLSLNDRDNRNYSDITKSLHDNQYPNDVHDGNCELRCRTWRRWEMESYLVCPEAIARLVQKQSDDKSYDVCLQEVKDYIGTLGIVVNADYKQSDKTISNGVLFDRDAKELVSPICSQFGITKFDIAKEMNTNEIFEDVRTLLNEILAFSRL